MSIQDNLVLGPMMQYKVFTGRDITPCLLQAHWDDPSMHPYFLTSLDFVRVTGFSQLYGRPLQTQGPGRAWLVISRCSLPHPTGFEDRKPPMATDGLTSWPLQTSTDSVCSAGHRISETKLP